MNATTTANYKTLSTLIKIVSIVLPVVVAFLFGIKLDIQLPFNVYILPLINAVLNGLSAVLLIGALVAVKQGNIQWHSRMIYLSMVVSIVFLLCYVLYHITTMHTSYTGEYRGLYLSLLFSHIVLAAVQPPFVLYAFLYGYTGQMDKHKRIVKWAFPIWLYVSITGVICYLMIAPYYPA